MHLTSEEKAMLEGEMGLGTQEAMKILVAIGEIYGAAKMVRVDRVHVAGGSVLSNGTGGVKFIEWLADNGAKARCFATVNPSAIEPFHWRELGIPEEYYELQMRLTGAYNRMNIVTTHCCTPYLLGNVPHFGECLASGESSAVPIYNGFFGARTNRQGGPSSIATAITRKVPVFGLLLDENRFGHFVIKVTSKCETPHDFSTLGYFAGKLAGDKVPVFTGIDDYATIDNCKMMTAGMNTSGAVAHFHIVGMTPEAPTLESALGGKPPIKVYEFTESEKVAVERKLCSATNERVDMVVIGCPHASVAQVQEVVRLLNGRKIASGITFQILTSEAIKALCDRQGYTKIIEDAGVMMLVQSCPACYPLGEVIAAARDIKSLATDSSKMAHYIAADSGRFPAYYGTTAQCVEAAVSGRWVWTTLKNSKQQETEKKVSFVKQTQTNSARSSQAGPIRLRGHKLNGGKVRGIAIVSVDSLSFWGGVNFKTGIVNERGHDIEGQSIAGKILICPSGKGSGGGSTRLYDMSLRKVAPIAIVNSKADVVMVIGAIISKIPMMDSFDVDPVSVIHTGDIVEVDADNGVVTIYPKGETIV